MLRIIKTTDFKNAIQWTGENLDEIIKFSNQIFYDPDMPGLYYYSLTDKMKYVEIGNYIIKDRFEVFDVNEVIFREGYIVYESTKD